MKLPDPAALAAAILLGAGLSPALAQNAPSSADPPAAAPQTAAPEIAAPATPQATTQPVTVRPNAAGGSGCAWKAKQLSS